MSKTVVGLFPSTVVAEDVRQQIINSGFAADSVRIVANDHDAHYGAGEEAGIGEKVSHFFKSLTGGDDAAHEHYATGLNQGGALLAITTEDAEADGAVALLRQHGARQIEGDVEGDRYAGSTSAGTDTTDRYAGGTFTGDSTSAGERTGSFSTRDADVLDTTGEQAIPVVEEDLIVGKREVDRGGVRVYSHVVETPVSTDVTLRDENIVVERRPVDRPATAADFAPGERAYELRASGEEAVVGKVARVVEEVRVGKNATEHTEAVRDTVRHTEVDVEEIPGEASPTSDRLGRGTR